MKTKDQKRAIARLQERCQTGHTRENYIWDFFQPIVDKLDVDANTRIEISSMNHNSDKNDGSVEEICYLLQNDRVMAFIINRRTAFNDHEFIFCQITP